MAITSVEAEAPQAAFTRLGNPPGQPQGRLIMMAMITFALFAVVLALPGLIAVLIGGEVNAEQNAR
jgi:hypothetical protein